MADPVGYVVALRYDEDGLWDLDSAGMWDTPEEAGEDRERAQAAVRPDHFPATYRVCAVVPLEDGGGVAEKSGIPTRRITSDG